MRRRNLLAGLLSAPAVVKAIDKPLSISDIRDAKKLLETLPGGPVRILDRETRILRYDVCNGSGRAISLSPKEFEKWQNPAK
jgi:hypothetical protein